jgi:hypothetical protein
MANVASCVRKAAHGSAAATPAGATGISSPRAALMAIVWSRKRGLSGIISSRNHVLRRMARRKNDTRKKRLQ